MTTKVRITNNVKEVDGTLYYNLAKPFGGSSHIVLPKKYIGQNIGIIIPNDITYSWLLSESERRETIIVCEKVVKKEKSKKAHYFYNNILNNLKLVKFTKLDLMKAVELLKQTNTHTHLADKIVDTYGLDK